MTSPPALAADADELAFLQLVEQSRERRCQALLEAADAEARALLQAARRDARARVQRAARDQRERRRLALEAAGAELATGLRLLQHQARRRWLEIAWPRLIEALHARWRDQRQRRAWLFAVVDLAHGALTGKGWRLEHPPGLDAGELASVVRAIRQRSGSAPEVVVVAKLGPGLRIHADGACVDGTIPGLIASAEQIEGRLLAELVAGVES
jgi:hypothetical protein